MSDYHRRAEASSPSADLSPHLPPEQQIIAPPAHTGNTPVQQQQAYQRRAGKLDLSMVNQSFPSPPTVPPLGPPIASYAMATQSPLMFLTNTRRPSPPWLVGGPTTSLARSPPPLYMANGFDGSALLGQTATAQHSHQQFFFNSPAPSIGGSNELFGHYRQSQPPPPTWRAPALSLNWQSQSDHFTFAPMPTNVPNVTSSSSFFTLSNTMNGSFAMDRQTTFTLDGSSQGSNSLANDIVNLTLCHSSDTTPFRPPVRPGLGKLGTPILLRANHFAVSIANIGSVLYHYSVTIEPPQCPRRVNRQVFTTMIEAYKAKLFAGTPPLLPVFDGLANMYTRRALPMASDGVTLHVTLPSDGDRDDRVFTVNIRPVGQVSLSALVDVLHVAASAAAAGVASHAHHIDLPQDSLQALDIVLRYLPSQRFTPVGRSFFQPPHLSSAFHCLGGGREVWFGHHQSLQPALNRMMLNVDVSATAFYRNISVLDFMCEVLEVPLDTITNSAMCARYFNDSQRVRFCKEIRGLKVEITHAGDARRRYRVTGMTRRSASTQTFPMDRDDATTIECTVQKYFFDKYRYEMKYPHLPCLQVGQEQKHTYLPLEVCRLVSGQRCMRKLTDTQTSTMIKATARTALDRETDINKLVAQADFAHDIYIDHYGVHVDSRMIELYGRVLDPPRLVYGGRQQRTTATPERGVWDMRNKTFHTGVSVHAWAICVFTSQTLIREDVLRSFVTSLQRISHEAGMPITTSPGFCKYSVGVEQVEPMFKFIMQTLPQIQLILVILPGKSPVYAEVKRVGDTLLGIATQCVQAKNVQRTSAQTLSNLCLKVNAKLGGTNNIVLPSNRPRMFNEPLMIMGVSLSHPPPGDPRKPTITAISASMDAHPWRYAAAVRVQFAERTVDSENGRMREVRPDTVMHMKTMVKQLLLSFYTATRFKPARLIFYRDSILPAQFAHVLRVEMRAIREACTSLETDYQPAITYIAVTKRHHTRFFCGDKRDMQGRACNVPAGTIVDTGISHPTDYDFFMCSHAGIQGTSRPTHYTVLYDDCGTLQDDMHELTYMLCHTYARCTRSVSVPAPVYYSQLVLQRARHYLVDQNESIVGDNNDLQLYHRAGSAEARRLTTNREHAARAVEVHPRQSQVMYFA